MSVIASTENNGFTNFQVLANSIMNDLKTAGFTVKYPATFTLYNPASPATEFTKMAVFETAAPVDPMAVAQTQSGQNIPAQPWRILIDASEFDPSDTDHGQVRIYMGTDLQIANDGTVSDEYTGTDGTRKSGELTVGIDATSKKPIPFLSYDFARTGSHQVKANIGSVKAHPFSYRLTVSNRGIACCIWEEASDDYGNCFSWFCAQRLVEPVGGTIDVAQITGRSPVFCLYSTGGGIFDFGTDTSFRPYVDEPTAFGSDVYNNVKLNPLVGTADATDISTLSSALPQIFRMTVRERDVLRPTFPVNACIHTIDNAAVINPFQQVATYENGQYVVNLPQNFNSDRYVYKNIMDMVAYTSADVVPQWTKVTLTGVFTGKNFTYMAMHANLPNNNGMRVLFLTAEA